MALLKLEYDRAGDSPALLSYLNASDPKVAAAAMRVAGRIGAGYTLPAAVSDRVLNAISSTQAAVRAEASYAAALIASAEGYAKAAEVHEALRQAHAKEIDVAAKRAQIFALGTIGTSADVNLLMPSTSSADLDVREASLMALWMVFDRNDWKKTPIAFDEAFVESMLAWVNSSADPRTEQAAQLIYQMSYKFPEFEGSAVRMKAADSAATAKFALSRAWLMFTLPGKTPAERDALIALSRDTDVVARANWATFSRYAGPADAALVARLVELLSDPSRKVARGAAGALSDLAGAAATAPLFTADVLTAIRGRYAVETTPVTKAKLLRVMVAIDKAGSEAALREALNHSEIWVRWTAYALLPRYANAADQAAYEALVRTGETTLKEIGVVSVGVAGEAQASEGAHAAIVEKIRMGDISVVRASVSKISKWTAWTDLADAYVSGYLARRSAPMSASAESAFVTAMANSRGVGAPEALRLAMGSPYPSVAAAAHKAFTTLAGADDTSIALPTAPPAVSRPMPDYARIQKVMRTAIRWELPSGVSITHPVSESPLSADALLARVETGGMDNTACSFDYSVYFSGFGAPENAAATPKNFELGRDEHTTPAGLPVGTLVLDGDNNADTTNLQPTAILNNRFYYAKHYATMSPVARVVSGLEAWVQMIEGDKLVRATALPMN